MPVPPPILAELLVDQRQVGLVSLDASGAIVGTNALGREILRQDAGLCERDGKLRTQRVEDAEALECLLAPAVGGQMESGSAGFAAVRGWPSWRPLTVYVNRANGSCPGVAAIVVVLDPWRRIRLRPEQVAKSLGLTPAESRVAVSLAEGLTIREIAESTPRRLCPFACSAGSFADLDFKAGGSGQTGAVQFPLAGRAVWRDGTGG